MLILLPIFFQPDLGGAVSIGIIMFLMVVVSGLQLRKVFLLTFLALIFVGVGLFSVSQKDNFQSNRLSS